MQVSSLSLQLGFGSELHYGYRDSTSVAYGQQMDDLLPRTSDQLRLLSNIGSIFSNLYTPERLRHLKS